MDILVRKYGGTSVADLDRMRGVALSVARAHLTTPTVVVVSAQGDATDRLLRTAVDAGMVRPTRETDQLLATAECASAALLAITLQAMDVPAVSLTGGQAGISVAGPPGAGRVVHIDPAPIRALLETGAVVVVAGFHGVDDTGTVVTLGRGGSDTTAVAVAVALDALRCEIYTDVDGVCSADPRIVETARQRPTVEIEPMVELAFAGAKVLHPRAVELAAARRVELLVANSLHDRPGTVIAPKGGDHAGLEEHRIVAVTSDLDVARVLIRAGTTNRDAAVDVLNVFARHNAPVDLVARSGPYEDEFRMGFTMRHSDFAIVGDELNRVVTATGGTMVLDERVGKISMIGTGLLNRPQYTADMLAILAAAGIAMSWVSTSQLRTSVIVPVDRAHEAVALLHERFLCDEHADSMAIATG
ncbi:aspartate kinase [Actinophytocola sp.]|uniref:aspartate kinase n=1 Tax=Actinophytocola sp. TaxID=1872138 RepID=UPI002ED0C8D8